MLAAGGHDLKCLQKGMEYTLQNHWVEVASVCLLQSIGTHDTIPTKNGRELMEKWVSELKDKFLGPNWQRMLSCAYTTQLLHSTGEVCWNNRDSYFIWFEFVC